MKKFVEPELRRIELKLTENIAASLQEKDGIYFGLRTRQYEEQCIGFIMTTVLNPITATPEELTANSSEIFTQCWGGASYSVVAAYYGL